MKTKTITALENSIFEISQFTKRLKDHTHYFSDLKNHNELVIDDSLRNSGILTADDLKLAIEEFKKVLDFD